mmetsp:Transcript_97932/g.280119  ORF Transcript_97932/g.280119 Transcript_97932/m.280119 type:complete len:222 (-) Transcript_97932:39-704(-)
MTPVRRMDTKPATGPIPDVRFVQSCHAPEVVEWATPVGAALIGPVSKCFWAVCRFLQGEWGRVAHAWTTELEPSALPVHAPSARARQFTRAFFLIAAQLRSQCSYTVALAGGCPLRIRPRNPSAHPRRPAFHPPEASSLDVYRKRFRQCALSWRSASLRASTGLVESILTISNRSPSRMSLSAAAATAPLIPSIAAPRGSPIDLVGRCDVGELPLSDHRWK